jgi:succinoglycan biosynthesis protein ExoU
MIEPQVCVIIAAKNGAPTIAVAIASALREPEVAEIIVVDDASTDDTAAVAHAADDGSGRLKVIRLDVNRGPSFARNVAIAASKSPFISILDADDFFLEGRFRQLFAVADWDFAADNIMLVGDDATADLTKIVAPRFAAEPEFLQFERFVEGNISRRGVQRGELGSATTRTCGWAKIMSYMPGRLHKGRGSRSSAPAAMAPSCAPTR